MRFLLLVWILSVVAPVARAQTAPDPLHGSMVSVRVVDGFTPYGVVTYEVLWRSRVAVASHYRNLINYSEALHQMRLVPRDEYEALLQELRSAGAFELESAIAPATVPGSLTYEIELRHGAEAKTIRVTAPTEQRNPLYAMTIERIRTFVLRHAGDIAFRNVFFEPGTFGYVNLTSVPVARVYVDGRDISQETPVYGYELPAGSHEVKLVAVEQDYERTHTLRVQPGMTTIVHFDLR